MLDPDALLKTGPLPDAERRLLEAAWRFQVVAPLLDANLTEDDKRRIRQNLVAESLDHPWRGKVQVSERTLRRWCLNYRRQGLAGLKLQPRRDRGRVVCLPEGRSSWPFSSEKKTAGARCPNCCA